MVFDRVIKTTKIFKLRKRLILVQTPTIASCKRSSIFRQKNTTVRFTLTRCMSEKRMFLIKKKQVTSRPLILFLKKMVCPRFFNNGGGGEQIVNKKLYVIFRVLYARISASIANNFFLEIITYVVQLFVVFNPEYVVQCTILLLISNSVLSNGQFPPPHRCESTLA